MQRILKFFLFAISLFSISFAFSHYFANAQILSEPSVLSENSSEIGNDDHDRYTDPLHSYTIREGDTLLSIALEINVDLNDMHCILDPGFLRTEPLIIGKKLSLPLVDAACHLIRTGDSLATVAERYHVLVSELVNMAWNQAAYPALTTLSPGSPLSVGLFLRIPPPDLFSDSRQELPTELPAQDFSQDIVNLAELLQRPIEMNRSGSTTGLPMAFVMGNGSKNDREQGPTDIDYRSDRYNDSPTVSVLTGPMLSEKNGLRIIGPTPSEWPYGNGDFVWPLQGWLTQDYHTHHRAVDIAVPLGTPIAATDRGTVVRAGWNDQGYGLFVIIDHNIGYVTLYAHMSEIWVTEGEVVTQGQFLGAVGSTGNSTGPHLHFELRDFGQRVDPLSYLSP